jgi:hypothetical protein
MGIVGPQEMAPDGFLSLNLIYRSNTIVSLSHLILHPLLEKMIYANGERNWVKGL